MIDNLPFNTCNFPHVTLYYLTKVSFDTKRVTSILFTGSYIKCVVKANPTTNQQGRRQKILEEGSNLEVE